MASEFRCQVEVFRFLPVEMVLLEASMVASKWHKATESEELWSYYCDLHEIEPEGTNRIPWKTEFQRHCCVPKTLPVVTKKALILTAVANLTVQVVKLSKAVSVDTLTTYCFLNGETLMTCGDFNVSARPYKICINTGKVMSLTRMRVERYNAPLVKYHGRVYSFGGDSPLGRLSSVECYNIRNNKWTKVLSKLTYPWAGMIPARHYNVLYIPVATVIDIFNFDTEEMRQFPSQAAKVAQYSLAHVTAHDELVVIQKNQVMKCSLHHSSSRFATEAVEGPLAGKYWSHCLAVGLDCGLFTLWDTGDQVKVLRFDLVTNRFEEVEINS